MIKVWNSKINDIYECLRKPTYKEIVLAQCRQWGRSMVNAQMRLLLEMNEIVFITPRRFY